MSEVQPMRITINISQREEDVHAPALGKDAYIKKTQVSAYLLDATHERHAPWPDGKTGGFTTIGRVEEAIMGDTFAVVMVEVAEWVRSRQEALQRGEIPE